MAEGDFFQFGNVVFPLADQAAGASLLAVCDPALAKIQDYLAFEIDHWLDKVVTSTLSRGTPPVGKNIAMRLSVEPVILNVKADQLRFPLFCVWRNESAHSDRTKNWRQDVHRMSWSYSLPAMTLEWADKFAHVLHAVVDIVNYALHAGHDPAYNNDEHVIGDNQITSAWTLSTRYGPYQLGEMTDTKFYSVFGELQVVEQSRPTRLGLPDYAGSSLSVTDESTQENNPTTVVEATVDA
jgi:hypothetical protein